MQAQNFTVSGFHGGMTVRDYTRRVLGLSARVLSGLKKTENGLQVNGAHAKSTDQLRTGDVLTVGVIEEHGEYETVQMELEIVYEDENFLVVNKPAGVTVYPCGKHTLSLLNGVAYYFKSKGESRVFRPFYRLDRDTSGLVVIAKSSVFMAGTTVEKEYFALCRGEVPENGTVDTPIGRPDAHQVTRAAGFGQKAVTHFERLAFEGGISLLKLQLETGRTHQIRVHMASIGAPLLGDDLYGGDLCAIRRQALHCKNCRVKNSALGLDILLETPYPTDFTAAFPRLAGNERNSLCRVL